MKNFFNLNQLSMSWNEKQKPQRFRRYAAILVMLLTLGVGQMWATKTIYYANPNDWNPPYCYAWGTGNNGWPGKAMTATDHKKDGHTIYKIDLSDSYTKCIFSNNGANQTGDITFTAGKVTSDGSRWYTYNASYWDAEYGEKNIYLDISNNTGWKVANGYVGFHLYWDKAVTNGQHKERLDATLVEGNIYVLTYSRFNSPFIRGWKAARWSTGGGDDWNTSKGIATSSTITDNKLVIPSGGWSNCDLSWGLYVPTVSSVALSYNVVPASGSGTEGDPYIVATGTSVTVTATPTSVINDSQCTMKYKWDNGSYGTTSTKTLNCSTNNTKYSTTVTCQNYISSTGGTTASATVWFKAVTAPTIGLSAPETGVRGNSITLTASTTNASTPTIVYEYSTSSTFASSVTTIASTTSTTQSWTIPSGTSATTYYLRAKMQVSSTWYYSSILTLTAYGKKTIHVKNSNNWGTLYLYAWDSSSNKLNGNWPGKTGAGSNGLSCTNTGGQWWDITITSQVSGFILNANVSGNANQTADLSYSTYTNNGCLAISTTTDGSGKRTLPNTAVDCPSAPDVTTAEAGSFTNSKATLNASGVAANNDAITAYGFKWGTTTACANTQAASNLSSTTFSYQLTGLTAGTTYYFKAYATNGQGTTYGEVESFTVPYKVTITKPTGCSAMTPGTSTQYVKVGDAITATAATGYQFSSWTVSNLTLSTPSTTSGVTTSTITAISSDNGTITAVYNPITYSNLTLGKTTGSADGKYSVTYNATSLTVTTAPTKTGYSVEGYYKTYSSSTWTTKVATANGTLQASTGYTDADKKWTSTASPTLYTKWQADTYSITLHDNNGGSHNGTATATYDSNKLTSITAPTRTGYHLVDGYYKESGKTNKISDLSGNLQASTAYTTSGKLWNSTSGQTLYAKWAANTYTIAFNANDAQYVGEATGSMDDQAATWGNYPTLTSNGFTREGYTFAGWATSPTGAVVYSNGQTLSTNLTNDNNATVTLYAKWTGRTYTVTFNARGGSGLTPTSKDVTMGSAYGELATVTPPAGYVFDGWYTATGGGTKVTSATQVTTAVDHTLYARYIQKAQVYFKNTIGWSQVWVTYDANWDGTQGTGNQGKTYHQMKLVSGTTDIYYDDIPDEYITSWRWNIAFNNTYQNNYHAFTKGEAVFRYDFDRKSTMFVPTSNTGSTADGNYQKNGVQYRSTGYSGDGNNPQYTSGYWRKYNDTYSGYTMTYQKSGGSWSSGHKMESSNVSSNVFIYTVHMDANSQYNFAFYKERDVNTKSVQFNYRTQITSTACTDLRLVCDPNNAWMRTTVEGDYVFKLEMKNDGHMYLTVEYPFKANDYKVVYSYTKDGAKTYDSEIIHGRANGLDTISVFIHSSSDASSRSLKIAQCTEINASGVPTWDNSYATIDISSVSESGVYNFIITQDGSAAATGAYWNKYTGNYYIRTESSDGGWDMYKYRPDNIMTLSEYSLTQTLSDPFSHYYCRFIGSTSVDITYAVATDYSPNISGTMTGDATIGGGATTLPATANVRFSWNEKTNALRRAYLKNAQGAGNNRYLVLHGADNKIRNNDATGTVITPSGDLVANELLFTDIGNWVYQVELKAIPGAKVSLIANYNSADRYLVGDGDTKWETIIGGTGSSLYSIKAVYDFKTNRLMTAWIPGGDITEDISDVDVLLLRYAQNAGTAITFGGDYTVGAKEVIGAIEMRYNDLVGHVAAWTSSSRPLLKFFVSFPFDVNVSDIFGLNSAYGDAYIVEEYDGAGRAEKGFFGGDGTTTFWKELQPGDVMLANVGYCVILDNDYFNGDIGNIWDNKSAGSSVYLYFPSASSVGDIESSSETISIPEHLCHHDRTFMTGGSREVNHINTDSHWNMMGVPIFDTHSDPGTSGQPGAVFAMSGTDGDGNFNYFYEWNPSNNQFSIHTAVNYSFKCMHGYMVQYHGNVTFKTAAAPASVAARRAPQKENYQIELQVLNNNADVLNSAFVELRENACDTFELNEDVYMSFNNLAVNIYTLAGNYDVAANVLSVGNHTIPVGVKVTKAGTYTFSMPSNFSGTATLVDLFTGERTNLALDDYEVNLQKGVIEDRFLLEIDVQQVATAIDGASGEGSLKDGKAHKFLQNNTLYILQNGVLYDARGARVQ